MHLPPPVVPPSGGIRPSFARRCAAASQALLAAAFLGTAATATHAASTDWAPNVTWTGAWHSNATNAPASADKLDSLQLNADLLSSRDYQLGASDTIRLTAHLNGDYWPRYRKLLTGAAGGRAEFRHTFGVDALAPSFSIEAGADSVWSGERAREGTSSFASAAIRKRLNDRLRATLSHEVGRLDARGAVYDRTSNETSLEFGYDLTPKSRLTLTARYRSGDIVSYSDPNSLALLAGGRDSVITDTFDRPLRAAAYDARTVSGRVAYVRAFDDASALVIAFEARKNRADSLRFNNEILSVGIIHQF